MVKKKKTETLVIVKNEEVNWGAWGVNQKYYKPLLDLKVGYSLKITNATKNTGSILRSWLINNQKGNYRVKTRFVEKDKVVYIGKFDK